MGLRGEAVEKREARRREGRWREAVEIGAVERGGGGAWLRAIDGELLYSSIRECYARSACAFSMWLVCMHGVATGRCCSCWLTD